MIHLNQAVIVEGKYDKIKLKNFINAEIITTEEAIKTKSALLEKYDPFTRCLEEVDSWQNEL